jgi:hypothetical protein
VFTAGAILGVLAGYAWRSYAPVPLPGETPLSSDQHLVQAVTDRARGAEEEAARLRGEVNRLQRVQLETEEKLADLQIQATLGGAGDPPQQALPQ